MCLPIFLSRGLGEGGGLGIAMEGARRRFFKVGDEK